MRFRITPGSQVAIYKQIADQVRRAVASGELAVGDSLPSVRALAGELVVNANTVAKAYAELTQSGVLESRPGRGLFVAKKRSVFTKAERHRRLDEALDTFIGEAVSLDFSAEEIVERLRERLAQLKLAEHGDGA